MYASDELEETFRRYYESAPPESREKLDELKRDSRVRIHLIRGQLNPELSRGAASGPHESSAEIRQACIMHPAEENDAITPDFDWDVVLDEQTRKSVEEATGFRSPVGALLEHELFGHFMRCYTEGECRIPRTEALRWWTRAENQANGEENKYRVHNHLPLVNWTVTPSGQRTKAVAPRAP